MTFSDNDVAMIGEIRRAFEAAENAGDADAAAEFLAPDAVIMVPDFDVQEGREACLHFLRDVMSWLREHFERHVTYISAEVTGVGDVAFDRGSFTFFVTPRSGGETEAVTGKYFWLLRRTDGSWKVWRLIISRDGPGETTS